MNKRFFGDVSVRCAAFLMAYYSTNSVFQSFMSLYYKDGHIGLNGTQVGSINALIAVISVPMMIVWGHAGDRAKVRNRLIAVMCLCSGALMLLVRLSNSFWYILLMIGLFASFYTSIQPMGDSVVLTALDRENRPFGPVRMAGGLSFAVVALLFGYIMKALGYKAPVYATAALCGVIALSALYMPRVSGGETRAAAPAPKDGNKKAGLGMLSLFKDRELLILFCLMVPLQLTYGYFYAFFSPMLVNELGGTESYVGWAYFLSACSEVPFLLRSDKLFKKYGAGRLMCVSALFMTARWFIVATTRSALVAVLSQLLHSMGFIVITVTVAKYVQATVPGNRKASGQLLISVFGFGIARALGYFLGGVFSDLFSSQSVFYGCAALCLLCLVVFTPYYFRRPPLNGESQ